VSTESDMVIVIKSFIFFPYWKLWWEAKHGD